jgi:hypothetical protein
MRQSLCALTLLLCAMSNATAAPRECEKTDIHLDNFSASSERGVTRIFGRIKNRCPMPAGVQIKVIFYSSAGDLLKVVDMWPASVNNIDPNALFPFEVTIDRVNGFDKVEASVIRVSTW